MPYVTHWEPLMGESTYTLGMSENQCNLSNSDSKYGLCEWIPDTFDES
jgi:hypothetical protein